MVVWGRVVFLSSSLLLLEEGVSCSANIASNKSLSSSSNPVIVEEFVELKLILRLPDESLDTTGTVVVVVDGSLEEEEEKAIPPPPVVVAFGGTIIGSSTADAKISSILIPVSVDSLSDVSSNDSKSIVLYGLDSLHYKKMEKLRMDKSFIKSERVQMEFSCLL